MTTGQISKLAKQSLKHIKQSLEQFLAASKFRLDAYCDSHKCYRLQLTDDQCLLVSVYADLNQLIIVQYEAVGLHPSCRKKLIDLESVTTAAQLKLLVQALLQ